MNDYRMICFFYLGLFQPELLHGLESRIWSFSNIFIGWVWEFID